MTCDSNLDSPHWSYDPMEKITFTHRHWIDKTDPRCQLQELESHIAQLKALLEVLEHRHVPLLKREINRRFPPILRLPPELSSQIFTAAFPENSWDTRQSSTPLIFGGVCSTWRRIAWSTPRLWNTVSLRRQKYTSVHIELLEEWLERSGQCPLHVHLTCPGVPNSVSLVKVTPLWQIIHFLSSSSERWRNIDLDFLDPIFLEIFFSISCQKSLPLLNSLTIKLGTMTNSQHCIQPFRHAPKLRSLRLKGAASLKSLTLPIHQLARVWLANTSLDECLDLLKDNPQLSHCTIDCIERGNTASLTHVSVSQLESLDIYLGDRRAASEIFDYLTTPFMRELAIHTYILPFRTSSFTSFVQRSSCFLKRLTLSSIIMSEKEFVNCMRVMPSLVDLELQYTIVTSGDGADGASRALTIDLSDCLLPNLRKLRYTTQFVHLPGWLDMLSSRWRLDNNKAPRPSEATFRASRLQCVRLLSNSRDVPDADTLAGFTRLVAEGMDISLTTLDRTWL